MRRLACLYIHGLGLPNGINQDANVLKSALHSQNIIFKHINYAELFEQKGYSLPHTYFALGFKYFNSMEFKMQIFDLIRSKLQELDQEGDDLDLMIVSYSFGTIITPQFLYQFIHDLLPVGYLGTEKRLLQNLKLLVTMGCPYSWFCPERPIRPTIALDPLVFKEKGIDFQWVNLYYSSDILTTPLSILSPQLKHIIDHQIPYRDTWRTIPHTLFKMTPASHLLYPQDPMLHSLLIEYSQELLSTRHVDVVSDVVLETRVQVEPVFHMSEVDSSRDLRVLIYVHGMGDSEQYKREASIVYEHIDRFNTSQTKIQVLLVSFDYSSLVVESTRQHDLLEEFERIHVKETVDLKWLRSYVLTACPVTMGYMGHVDTQSRIHEAFGMVLHAVGEKYPEKRVDIVGYSLGSIICLKYLYNLSTQPTISSFYSLGTPASWMLESTTLDNLKHLKWKNFYYGNDVFCGAMGVDDVLLASPWNTVNEVFACFNALYVKDGNVWSHIFDSISLDVGPSGVASEVPKELYEDVYEVANDLDESVSEVTKELDQLNVLQGETKESKLETL